MARFLPPNYEKKFAEFIRMCQDAKRSGLKQIVVAHPSVIGDNYEENIESLSRLAEADLAFVAAKPEPQLKQPDRRN